MATRNLERLLTPRRVALIGAAPPGRSAAATVTQNLLAGRFGGELWFVAAPGGEALGHPAWADIESLPGPPDLAVVALPAERLPATVAALAARGTAASLLLETDGASTRRCREPRLREALLAAIEGSGMRLLGPNSHGLVLPGQGLEAWLGATPVTAGSLAFLSQSGSILEGVATWAGARGIGFSHLVSLGDMLDVDVDDLLDMLAQDAGTSAILVYLEAVLEARAFMSAARIAGRLKPVVVLKGGSTAAGRAAMLAARGGPLGDDRVYDAAFRRTGLLRVQSLPELLDAASILSQRRRVSGDRVAVVCNGGGFAVLASDAVAWAGGRMAVLGTETAAALDERMPAGWGGGNPVDIAAEEAEEDAGRAFCDAIAILRRDPGVDAILAVHSPAAAASGIEAARRLVAGLPAGRGPAVIAAWVGGAAASEARRILIAGGVPAFATPEEAARGLMYLVRHERSRLALMETPPSLPDGAAPAHDVRAAIASAVDAGPPELDQASLQGLLAAYRLAPGAAPEGPSASFACGLRIDRVFGPVVWLRRTEAGEGGTAFALPPLNLPLAHSLVDQALPEADAQDAAPRGRFDPLAQALVQVAQIAVDVPEIVRLDLLLQATPAGIAVLEAAGRAEPWAGESQGRLAIRPYPRELEGTLLADNGQAFQVRPIRPEDEPALVRSFDFLSAESIKRRFFAPLRAMSHEQAGRLTQIDYDREMALVLVPRGQPGCPPIVGVARYIADHDWARAEFAIVVWDGLAGQGLGRRLLQRLIDHAREAGVGRLEGQVLADNRPMLGLCRRLGFAEAPDPEDPGLRRVTLPLRPPGKG